MTTQLNPQPASDAHEELIELSIVMPCLNESETLETCIGKAKQFLERSGTNGEIVIGDNGSTDGSIEIAESLGARVVHVKAKGYGSALYHAIKACKGKYVIMGDSDDSYNFLELDRFVDKLREGYDLVMGNRFLGGIAPGAMPWKNRYIGNPVLTGIGKVLFNSPSSDFHCGLRGFSKEAFEKFDMRTTGMEFASEMVIKATLSKAKIAEVPTTLDPDGRTRAPHLKPWRDGWRHLRFMLLYSPKWLFLIPGLILIGIGLGFGAAVWAGPVTVANVTFDVHTLLFMACAVIIGLQSVFFAAFAKKFAISEGLLPQDDKMTKFSSLFSLERGLIAGVAVFALGLVGSIYSLTLWGVEGFSDLDPASMLRLVVPSVLGLCIGAQLAFSGFFLSVLDLKRRPLSSD